MLICGDTAVVENKLRVLMAESIKDESILLINLEGALVPESELPSFSNKPWVVNNHSFLDNLSSDFTLICGLSNNHIFDCPELGGKTINYFRNSGIQATGARYEHLDLTEPVRVLEKGLVISIICAGWDVIGCADEKEFGTNQLDAEGLHRIVRAERSSVDRVVVFLHWGYELEIYPHPADRRLAHDLVDAGADLIVGCHAHCIMGIEKYKGKDIVYGVGNFAFSQGWYMKGRIRFPDICEDGLCVYFDPVSGCSEFLVTTQQKEKITISTMTSAIEERTAFLSKPFALDLKSYEIFFKKNRRKKNFLPVFITHENRVLNKTKKVFLKVRGSMIRRFFLFGLKGGAK